MSPWSAYSSRINAHGGSKRGAIMQRESRFLRRKLKSSPSYHRAVIDGIERDVAIINSDNLDQKSICTLPGEDFRHGGNVEWMGNHWLITERDANNELYTKGIMRQCNYLLRWIDRDDGIVERWCIVEDGTKYLTGEYGDKEFIVDRGDSRISLTLPKDKQTLRLRRGNRFLIDDYRSPNVLAYNLTKPFKLGGSYDENGILCFVLQECATEDTDDLDLHIANYYKYFPHSGGAEAEAAPAQIQTQPQNVGNTAGKKVWI